MFPHTFLWVHVRSSIGLMVYGPLCHRLLGKQTGRTPDAPYLDPCLPLDIKDEIQQNGQTLYLRGTGDFDLCRETLQPFMNKTNETQTSLNGVYQPPIHFQNSEFYGFSEFYYCTEDVLRMGGDYNAVKFTKAAKVTSQENPCCIETIGLQVQLPLYSEGKVVVVHPCDIFSLLLWEGRRQKT